MNRLTITLVTTEACNLKCSYCINNSNESQYEIKITNFNEDSIMSFLKRMQVQHNMKTNVIDAPMLVLVGGEPLISPQVINIISRVLSETSYLIYLMTNGTFNFKNLNEQVNYIRHRDRVMFDVSFHYLELVKRNKLDVFVENINYLIKNPPNWKRVKAIATPEYSDAEINLINITYKKFNPVWGEFIGIYDGKKYPASYTEAECEKFNLDASIREPKINNGILECSALQHTLEIYNNKVYTCSDIRTNGVALEKFNLKDTSFKCSIKHCHCPERNQL